MKFNLFVRSLFVSYLIMNNSSLIVFVINICLQLKHCTIQSKQICLVPCNKLTEVPIRRRVPHENTWFCFIIFPSECLQRLKAEALDYLLLRKIICYKRLKRIICIFQLGVYFCKRASESNDFAWKILQK